jgi:hypothetical protein
MRQPRLRVAGSEISRGFGCHVVSARVAAVADGSDTSTAEELTAAMEDVISSGFALGADAPAMDQQQVTEVKRKLEVAGSLLEQALAARMVLEVCRPVPLSPRATPHGLRPLRANSPYQTQGVIAPRAVSAPTKHIDSESHQNPRASFPPASQLVRREYFLDPHGSNFRNRRWLRERVSRRAQCVSCPPVYTARRAHVGGLDPFAHVARACQQTFQLGWCRGRPRMADTDRVCPRATRHCDCD